MSIDLSATEAWARPGTKSRLLNAQQEEEIVALYESGQSMPQIARRFPCSWQTIQRLLARRGIKRRQRRFGTMASAWKGGRVITGQGYVEVVVPPDHPMRRASGRVLEHRLVMADVLGRPLTDKEVVHHINGDRTDNRVENLQLVSGQEHSRYQRAKCGTCGSRHIVYEELPSQST